MKTVQKILLLSLAAMLASCAESIFDLLPVGSTPGTPSASVTPIPVTSREMKEGQVAMRYNYKSIASNSLYPLDYAPTIGSAKLLVIPVWFKDSATFISTAKREDVRSDIEKAYFGSAEDTGWCSVKSFYEIESTGRLSLSGKVAPWYEINKSYRDFADSDAGNAATYDLVPEAVEWYFKNNPSENRADYDCDKNGYLDGVMLIYAAPDYVALGKSNSREDYTNLWAYCFWLQDKNQMSVSRPGPNAYFWASYDFMYDRSNAYSRTGASHYYSGNNAHTKLDAHTYIHEMGHVFGLDDYYDYGPSAYSDAGGFSMQDHNVGGHDPYSTMAFGWVDPYIPTESCDITLESFQKSRDAIVLTPSWNEYDSPFDEYFILELYTPDGLNALDATYTYEKTRGPSTSGIRLWHVDARLHACVQTRRGSDGYDYPVYSEANLTSNPAAGRYGVEAAFTNTVDDESYSGVMTTVSSKYDDYDLLQLVRNNTRAPLHNTADISNYDLFGNGSSFKMSDFSRQFPNGSKMNNGKDLGWSFSVSLQASGEDVKATVHLVKA
ncbi:MAG: hypothetical protein IJS52_01350 [Bacilli bacterium]|nr:hypothetical protein [Bacilli bacterium]